MYWNFNHILKNSQDPPFSQKEGPLVVEIGFGNGEYLEHLAKTKPMSTIVGIEVSQWCLSKAAQRALAGNLQNIRLLLGDARYLLTYAFEPASVTEVYMNFPCPWPKRRHVERRVARPQFAGLIASCLRPGGRFTLATDVDWYAEDTREVFASSSEFSTGPVVRNPEREYLTKYERKWREMGRDTYMVSAEKIACAECEGPDKGDKECVETMEIEYTTPVEELKTNLLALKGENLEGQEYRVMFRDVFFAEDGTALVMAISVDEGFEQHYYLRMIPAGGTLRGKVDSVGHPYRTPGVRASVRYVMKKLGAKF